MSTDGQKLLDAILTGWNQKDWETLEAVHAPDWVDRSAPEGMDDLASMKEFFDLFTTCFPDMEMEILHSFVSGDDIAYYYAIRGTQEKYFLGIPGKGQKVDFTGMMILKMRDGKCAEAWGVTDKMLLFDQLRSQTK
jgi:predicted ester cyclase